MVLLAFNLALYGKNLKLDPLTYVNVALSVSDFIQALNVIAVTLTLLVIAWQVKIANRLSKGSPTFQVGTRDVLAAPILQEVACRPESRPA